MARLRILQVIHSLEFGGAQRYLADLVAPPDDVVEWLVVGLAPPDPLVAELRAKGIEFVRILSSTRRDPSIPRKLREIIRGEAVDIVHAHGVIPPLWVMLALRGLGIPFVVGVNSQPSQVNKIARLFVRPIVFRRADAIVCASRAVRDELVRMYPAARGKATVIYNCVDAGRLRVTKSRDQVRAELGIDPAAALVCNVANIWWVKGHEYLIRAMAELVRHRPDAVAIVAGAATDKALAARVTALRDQLGLQDKVRFLGRRGDVPDLLAASDVFVLSSVTECLPVSIIEAMMLGRPVVATDVGGVRELVADGQTGFVVPPRQPKALADALLRVLDDPALAERFGAAGRARIHQLASVQSVRAAHLDLYKRLLTGAGVRAT